MEERTVEMATKEVKNHDFRNGFFAGAGVVVGTYGVYKAVRKGVTVVRDLMFEKAYKMAVDSFEDESEEQK